MFVFNYEACCCLKLVEAASVCIQTCSDRLANNSGRGEAVRAGALLISRLDCLGGNQSNHRLQLQHLSLQTKTCGAQPLPCYHAYALRHHGCCTRGFNSIIAQFNFTLLATKDCEPTTPHNPPPFPAPTPFTAALLTLYNMYSPVVHAPRLDQTKLGFKPVAS